MPIISVKMLAGRSSAQKADLIQELANGAVRALGVPEESVRITLIEIDPEHWGVGTQSKASRDRKRS